MPPVCLTGGISFCNIRSSLVGTVLLITIGSNACKNACPSISTSTDSAVMFTITTFDLLFLC